jgi:protein-S-isoprenylcysteine O-methyltransferase Ste14
VGSHVPPSVGTRRASDWLGFIGHLAIAMINAVRAPSLTVFILPPIIHMLFAAGSFLVRDQPKQVERNLIGRAVSYAGAFGMFLFIMFASMAKPEWLAPTANTTLVGIGVLLGLVGLGLEIWAIWHLKFAFSTEPAARRLVTTGPYRLSRHPIYTGGCIAYVGLLITRPTLPIAIALVVWAVCMRMRMRYEEAILSSVFPAYADYRARVSAIVPRFYPSSTHSTTTSISTGI